MKKTLIALLLSLIWFSNIAYAQGVFDEATKDPGDLGPIRGTTWKFSNSVTIEIGQEVLTNQQTNTVFLNCSDEDGNTGRASFVKKPSIENPYVSGPVFTIFIISSEYPDDWFLLPTGLWPPGYTPSDDMIDVEKIFEFQIDNKESVATGYYATSANDGGFLSGEKIDDQYDNSSSESSSGGGGGSCFISGAKD